MDPQQPSPPAPERAAASNNASPPDPAAAQPPPSDPDTDSSPEESSSDAEVDSDAADWSVVASAHPPRLDITLAHTLEHDSVACCVRFSADGTLLATGCNRTAQIYDTATGAKTCVLVHAQPAGADDADLYVRSVCFSPDGTLLATGAEDTQIRIWDIAHMSIQRIFEGHQQEIFSLDFSRDGRRLVSGSGDRTARIWDLETGQHTALLAAEPADVDAIVASVAISPDGRLVAAGAVDAVVRLWDAQTGARVARVAGHADSVYGVAFTPDGTGLVSGSLDRTLRHWDLAPLLRHPSRGVPLRQPYEGGASEGCLCTLNFTGHKDYVLTVAVSHDSQWVVSGSKDRCVQFWDLRTAQAQLMLQGHENSVISLDLSPAGGVLATGSGDWRARLWSYTTLQ